MIDCCGNASSGCMLSTEYYGSTVIGLRVVINIATAKWLAVSSNRIQFAKESWSLMHIKVIHMDGC